jgi:23S rRNA pseudouridine955/2504/2580 synthase
MAPTPRLLTRFGDVFYAFDKPAGLAVHPNAEGLPDLVQWIEAQRSLPRNLKPGHRLDRPTSGVVLCGAGRKARAQIADWLGDRAEKHYLALVFGEPEGDRLVFRDPLYDERRRRTLEAETRMKIREPLGLFTLVELQLVTGRKHQLRRHLAGAQLPVIGDRRYGPRVPTRVPGHPGRLWLHAWKLVLPDRTIESPLPEALEVHLHQLREHVASTAQGGNP